MPSRAASGTIFNLWYGHSPWWDSKQKQPHHLRVDILTYHLATEFDHKIGTRLKKKLVSLYKVKPSIFSRLVRWNPIGCRQCINQKELSILWPGIESGIQYDGSLLYRSTNTLLVFPTLTSVELTIQWWERNSILNLSVAPLQPRCRDKQSSSPFTNWSMLLLLNWSATDAERYQRANDKISMCYS